MKKVLVFLFASLFLSNLNAQLSFGWNWHSASHCTNNAFFFQQSITGNFITGGSAFSQMDLYAIDGNGNLQQSYIDSISGHNVKPVDGRTNSVGDLYFQSLNIFNSIDASRLIKLNSNFQFVWQLNFPTETSIGIELDQNQDIIMLSDSDKIILRKISPSGNVLWTTTNDSAAGNDHLKVKCLKLDRTGNIFVVSEKKIAGDYQYSLKKFWNNGSFAWEINYNPSLNEDIPHDLFVDDSCHIYITGESYITANGSQRGYASEKVDSSGNVIWSNNYSTHSNVGWRIMSDHAGNAYVAGSTFEIGQIPYVRILKYDPNGDTLWSYSADSLASVLQIQIKTIGFLVDSIGQVYFSFPARYPNNANTDLQFSKLSTNGTLIGTCFFTSGRYITNHIIETTSHQILIGGDYFMEAPVPPPNPDLIFIFAIDDVTGIHQYSEMNSELKLYPNPSSGQFTIEGDFPVNSEIRFYDLLGKEVGNSFQLSTGNQKKQIDLNLVEGIYVYRIISENEIKHEGKLVIIR